MVSKGLTDIQLKNLEDFLRKCDYNKEELGIDRITGQSPYYIQFEGEDKSPEELANEIAKICEQIESPTSLIKPDEKFLWQKYDLRHF